MVENKSSKIIKTEREKGDQEGDASEKKTLMDFLTNPEAVNAIEKLVINVMNGTRRGNNALLIYQGIGLVVIIIASVFLSIFHKMEPSVSVILGSLAGYLFGKGRE